MITYFNQTVSGMDIDRKYKMTLLGIVTALLQKHDEDVAEIVRCKDCKWFHDIGCAIQIVDDTDKPSENDYCSFAERRTDEQDD